VVRAYVDAKVSEAVLSYRLGEVQKELKELNGSRIDAMAQLDDARRLIDKAGARIETSRTMQEISDEIKFANAHLLSLGEIPDDTPSMYPDIPEDLQRTEAEGGCRRDQQEAGDRRDRREEEHLAQGNGPPGGRDQPIYHEVLAKVGGLGAVRLSNMDDPDHAGVEVSVGFRGTSPVLLDAYAQSGGERAVATMAFLLALQPQPEITSPGR
jgi:chromosome segregation protein